MIKKTLLLICAILVPLLILNAQTWFFEGQNIIGESEGDNFGISVSLNSDASIIAVGAWKNDGNGSDAGHVRIYENIGGSWTQVGEDIDGKAESNYSGISVSLSSDGMTIAIGALTHADSGPNAGYVRVYQNLDGTWTQIGEDIFGESGEDHFGNSVSISADGSVLAAGARFNDGNGTEAGHVRIYRNTNGSWTQIGDDIDGEAEGDEFGISVSLSSDGTILGVGAIKNDGIGTDAGHVRIFQNIDGSWMQIGNDIDGEYAGDWFGCSVSLNSDGSVLAVGGRLNDGNGTDAGHVRIFENYAGSWIQIGDDIDGYNAGDETGVSVDLSSDGSKVVVGAWKNDGEGNDAGHIRLYQYIFDHWSQMGEDLDGEAEGDRFGTSVSISSSGSIIAAGARANDENGTDAGNVRIARNMSLVNTSFMQNSIQIYPNPTDGIFHIDAEDSYLISVSDIAGKKLIEIKSEKGKTELDLSKYANGLYFITFRNSDVMRITKVIKK